MDDNLQVSALNQQLQANPQMKGQVDPTIVGDAWKMGKDIAQKQNLDPQDPLYWTKVTNSAKQSLGIFPDDQEKTGPDSAMGFKPAPPAVQPPNPTQPQKPVFEGYKSFAEEVKAIEEPQYKGQSKTDMAKDMIKKLRKDGRSDNEITNSLVNRMLFDFKSASDLVGLKDGPVEPKDPYTNGQLPEASYPGSRSPYSRSSKPRTGPRDSEEMTDADRAHNEELKRRALAKKQAKKTPPKQTEASAYDKGGILFQPGNPVEPTGTRDPFEWELSSTKYLAKAMIFLRQKQFEVRFEVLTTQTTKWPMDWRFLKPHGIVSALRITVNQLQANPNGMTASSIANAVDPAYADDVVKIMGKLMKSYVQIWKKQNYQIIVTSTTTGLNVGFITKLGKELAKIPSFKLDPGLQAEFCDPYVNLSKTRGYYIILKNTSASGFKEDTLRDETTSSAFSATPENAGVKGKTGPEINADASAHIARMRKNGFGAQLESLDKGVIHSYHEGMNNTIENERDLKSKREELYALGWRRQRAYGANGPGNHHPIDDQRMHGEAVRQAQKLMSDGVYEAQILTVPSHLTQDFTTLSGNHYSGDYPVYEVWYRPGKMYKQWGDEVPAEQRRGYHYDRPGKHGY